MSVSMELTERYFDDLMNDLACMLGDKKKNIFKVISNKGTDELNSYLTSKAVSKDRLYNSKNIYKKAGKFNVSSLCTSTVANIFSTCVGARYWYKNDKVKKVNLGDVSMTDKETELSIEDINENIVYAQFEFSETEYLLSCYANNKLKHENIRPDFKLNIETMELSAVEEYCIVLNQYSRNWYMNTKIEYGPMIENDEIAGSMRRYKPVVLLFFDKNGCITRECVTSSNGYIDIDYSEENCGKWNLPTKELLIAIANIAYSIDEDDLGYDTDGEEHSIVASSFIGEVKNEFVRAAARMFGVKEVSTLAELEESVDLDNANNIEVDDYERGQFDTVMQFMYNLREGINIRVRNIPEEFKSRYIDLETLDKIKNKVYVEFAYGKSKFLMFEEQSSRSVIVNDTEIVRNIMVLMYNEERNEYNKRKMPKTAWKNDMKYMCLMSMYISKTGKCRFKEVYDLDSWTMNNFGTNEAYYKYDIDTNSKVMTYLKDGYDRKIKTTTYDKEVAHKLGLPTLEELVGYYNYAVYSYANRNKLYGKFEGKNKINSTKTGRQHKIHVARPETSDVYVPIDVWVREYEPSKEYEYKGGHHKSPIAHDRASFFRRSRGKGDWEYIDGEFVNVGKGNGKYSYVRATRVNDKNDSEVNVVYVTKKNSTE